MAELEEQLEEARLALAEARGSQLENRLGSLMTFKADRISLETQITDLEGVVGHLITELQKRSAPLNLKSLQKS